MFRATLTALTGLLFTFGPGSDLSSGLASQAGAPLGAQDGAQDEAQAADTEKEDQRPEVEWQILFDVEKFIPGNVAHMVVVLKIPKKWHIYWETAGQSGMPTTLKVTGPKDWKIHAPIFPGPRTYVDAQSNVTQILEGEVGFFVPILPPDDAVAGTQVEFQVKMDWLQCKESCILGKIETKAQHSVGSGLPKRVIDRRLVGLRKKLPRSGLIMRDVGISFSGDPKKANLTFHARDARKFDFFPRSASPMVMAERESEVSTDTFSQRNFRLEPAYETELEDIQVQGVLRMEWKDKVLFFDLAYTGAQLSAPDERILGHGSLPVIPKGDKKPQDKPKDLPKK